MEDQQIVESKVRNAESEELQVHLQEYNYVLTHVIERSGFRHTLMNYGLVLIAATVALALQVYDKAPLHPVLLLLPLPFYGLAAMLIENDLIIASLVGYFYHNLRHKVAEVICVPVDRIWTIEEYLHATRNTKLYRISAASRYGLLLFPVPIFLVVYWQLQSWQFIEVIPVVLSVAHVGMLVALVVILMTQVVNPPDLPKALQVQYKRGKPKSAIV